MQFLTADEQRIRKTLALGDLLENYGGTALAFKVLKAGGGEAELMNLVAEKSRKTSLADSADRMLGIDSTRDGAGYSISRALRAAMERRWDNAGLESDLSSVVTTATGVVPHGFYVPLGVLARDFNVGTAAQAGNLSGATAIGPLAVDPLRKVSALARMGMTLLSGLKMTMEIPRFSSSTSAAWKSEVAAATEVLEQTGRLDLIPKRLSVTKVLSRQALIQAAPALDIAIGRHLVAALMEKLEDGALNGSGSGDEPTGLRATSGIGVVTGGTNGAAVTWAHLCDLEDKPAAANSIETEFAGFVVNSKTRRYLRALQRAAGLPFVWESSDRPLLGHRAAVTNNVPSNLEKGTSGAVCSSVLFSSDWSSLIGGIYGGGVDLTVDRTTMADVGKVRITASLEAGVGAMSPEAFAAMDDALTA